MSPDYMLVGLLEDASGLVVRAIGASGLSPSRIRATVGAGLSSDSGVPAGNEIRPDLETNGIRQRALAEAISREHVYVEPGHLLLAIATDPACSAYHLLLDLGAELEPLVDWLIEMLPTSRVSEAFLCELHERFPRLATQQLRELTDQALAWQGANRILREEAETLSSAERARLNGVQAETRGAWLRLVQHHAYVVWEAADYCRSQGHDMIYAYNRANRALSGACLSFSRGDADSFETYARSCIAASLTRSLGCSFAEDWITKPKL